MMKAAHHTTKNRGDESPRAKPLSEFTGKGKEIFGDPQEDGELLYNDGQFFGVSTASSDNPTRVNLTAAKEAAWFNMERQNRILSGDDDDRIEDRAKAERISGSFADAIFEGRLVPLARAILKEDSKERSRFKDHEESSENGYRDALSGVAKKAAFPAAITKSAILDYLKRNDRLCKEYDITPSSLTARKVDQQLQLLGFGWLPKGRTRGRPLKK